MGKRKRHTHAQHHKQERKTKNRLIRRAGILSGVLVLGVATQRVVESLPIRGLAHSVEIALAASVEAVFNKFEEDTRG